MTHSLHLGEYLGDSLKGQFLRKIMGSSIFHALLNETKVKCL